MYPPYWVSSKEGTFQFGMHYQTLAKLEEDSTNAPYRFIQAIPNVYKVASDDIFLVVKTSLFVY